LFFRKSFRLNQKRYCSGARVEQVTVIGGGLMGSGIAQVVAEHHKVTLVELNDAVLTKSLASLTKDLERVAKKRFTVPEEGALHVKKVLGNITTSTDVEKSVSGANLVIEAIIENLAIKQEFFAKIDKVAPSDSIFASNTSSFAINLISQGCSTQRQSKFGGLHFFNPVPMMKLVEVVKAESTSADTHNYLLNFCKGINKTPITCKDTPGFVVNRLLVPYIMEAVRLLERDVSSREDIDIAMKLGAGYPMGPFELADFVGLDTLKSIIDGWNKLEPNNELFKQSHILNDLVTKGKFGRKTGAGFYDYAKK